MFELIAGIMALGLAAQVVFWVFAAVVFPVFWLWMVVDAALRRPEEYPGSGTDAKVIWIVLMILIQVACVPYFFMVYRRARRLPYGAAGVASV